MRLFLRKFPLLVCLFLGAFAPSGCHKDRSKQITVDEGSLKKSIDGLKPQFAELKKRFMDLRTRVDAIPADFPGFGETRARFYAAEEGRGVTEAKVAWLSERLNTALSSGHHEELAEISKEVASTQEDIRRIDEYHTKLLHQVMTFERLVRQEAQAGTAEQGPPPAPPKSKSSKAKP